MKKRADLLLVELGLLPSRTKAQDMIRQGLVSADGETVTTVSQLLEPAAKIEIMSNELLKYVSRGGLKLEAALKHLSLNPKGKQILDVGISTGGFTDCLLKMDVSNVVGIDVGHDQLHPSLRQEKRLTHLEGINAREMSQILQKHLLVPNLGFDLVVVDVSFISLTLLLDEIFTLVKSSGEVLALVKPQFEVGPEGLGKGGLVKDVSFYPLVEKKLREKSLEVGLTVRDYFPSDVIGKDGNQEFFLYANK